MVAVTHITAVDVRARPIELGSISACVVFRSRRAQYHALVNTHCRAQCPMSTVVHKKCYFHFRNYIVNCRPILIIILSLLHSRMNCRKKTGIKYTTSPQTCCCITLRKMNVRLCNFTARYPVQLLCKVVYLQYIVYQRH